MNDEQELKEGAKQSRQLYAQMSRSALDVGAQSYYANLQANNEELIKRIRSAERRERRLATEGQPSKKRKQT